MLVCGHVVCQPVSDYRYVNGQLYNVRYSTNWINIPLKCGFAEVVDVTTNGVLLQEHDWNKRTGEKMLCLSYFVRHLPGEARMTTGYVLMYMPRVMQVGAISENGKRLAVYDFGTPAGATPKRP